MATNLDPGYVLRMFDELDVDGSGCLTGFEIRKLLKEQLGLEKAALNAFVEAIDLNNDKKISVTELQLAIATKSTFAVRTCWSTGRRLGIDEITSAVEPPAEETFHDLLCGTLVEWDFSPGGHGRARNERLGPPARGCTIEEPELRALRLCLLRSLYRHVSRRCAPEAWVDTTGAKLPVEEASMYDVIAYAIKPATRTRQCSLMELVSDSHVVPQWFLSHAWADRLSGVVACAEQHARDRGSDANTTAYWLAAGALNQWAPGELWYSEQPSYAREPPPTEAAFARAMRKSLGTLCVVDPHAHCLARLWVCYEVSLALGGEAGVGHRLDIYTPWEGTYETGRGQELACSAVGRNRTSRALVGLKSTSSCPYAYSSPAASAAVAT